jgi:hypothetical protein
MCRSDKQKHLGVKLPQKLILFSFPGSGFEATDQLNIESIRIQKVVRTIVRI